MNAITTDSLIFDLDGTLWDASETCAKAWSDLLTQKGITQYSIDAPAIRAVSGLSIDKVFKEHFTFIPQEMRSELLEAYKPTESAYMRKFGGILYPDVKEVLTQLTLHYKLFVVSTVWLDTLKTSLNFIVSMGYLLILSAQGKPEGLRTRTSVQSLKETRLKNQFTSEIRYGILMPR